ncbi:MAG TPA: FAD-dependent oxidoreductase [Chthoniobacterales bacterium]|nr:FAD-dependent oxidoreductase [Chthoniobacterales bacterium]
MARQVDYLIVGQGLAGSLLACLLHMRRKDALVIDNAHRTAASLCAAGIMNPITGKRLNRPALIDRLLDDSFRTYPSIERFLGASFFRRRKVLRLLQSAKEHLEWKERFASGDYAKYLGSLDCSCTPSINGWFGCFEIALAGHLDVAAFIRRTRDRLTATGRLVESEFNSDELQFSNEAVNWRDYAAQAVVFCEGYKLSENPFFKSIELRPAKGEVLTLRAPSFSDDRIIQRGKWLFRSTTEEIKAGTTYAWDWENEMPTRAARAEIEQSIRQFANFDFEVIQQAAGVRPVVRVDNRPLVGAHPENRRIAVLNGLGSKGVLQAPFAARQLIGYLERGEQIHPEFDVCRKSLWKSLERD